MQGKRNLYRGKKNLDYEIPLKEKKESLERIKEYMRKSKNRNREKE